MSILLSTAYLAPIQYYSKLISDTPVLIEQHENYIKQSYRNRCTILSANGPMPLSIPIESAGGKKCPIRDVRIAEHGNWRHLHWNALISAYNSTPFFEYYEDDFRPFYEKKYKFLFDFNEEIRLKVCELLTLDISNIYYTDDYISEIQNTDTDLRETLSPKKDFKIFDTGFISIPYYQVFDTRYGFTENLSIADLLFNMGNESLLVLEKSTKKIS
ncbi:WbqC family protein [Dysgonomonas macrotermitis]|uniref:WbqC-like protein family protein n=1 Tax=Dysgonomonas macrotermitis TaxID=1346286 RepID=A0A1M5I2L8_9BACT|nr:WbqC family protein [Dysgonomonas macrotermitis]SHG22260.1 WbqC-like protein family protein [Dysgonomonas macrotermitis]